MNRGLLWFYCSSILVEYSPDKPGQVRLWYGCQRPVHLHRRTLPHSRQVKGHWDWRPHVKVWSDGGHIQSVAKESWHFFFQIWGYCLRYKKLCLWNYIEINHYNVVVFLNHTILLKLNFAIWLSWITNIHKSTSGWFNLDVIFQIFALHKH